MVNYLLIAAGFIGLLIALRIFTDVVWPGGWPVVSNNCLECGDCDGLHFRSCSRYNGH